MNRSHESNGWKAIQLVGTGIALMAAVMGLFPVAYWGIVWLSSDSYRTATFKVEDAWLEDSPRNPLRFWTARGEVNGTSEILAKRWHRSDPVSPFKDGEIITVRCNPKAFGGLIGGRSLRVLVPEDYLATGRNLVSCLAIFYGPGAAWGMLRFARRLQGGAFKHSISLRGRLQAWTIAIVFACSGCEHTQHPGSSGLMDFCETLKRSYEHGDAGAVVAQISTNSVPSVLLEATKQSLLVPISLGNVRVHSCKVYPFSKYKPTTGAPGVYDGRTLGWSLMPTHWVVLAISLEQTNKPDLLRLRTRFKLELAVSEMGGRWRIVGPTYAE